MSSIKVVTLWVRRKIEVCTDPQRRCYNGAFARSEWVWGEWMDLFDLSSWESAEESRAFYSEINPTREYRVMPLGERP
jgi:hypothetical protein